jgi:hypothetical protein
MPPATALTMPGTSPRLDAGQAIDTAIATNRSHFQIYRGMGKREIRVFRALLRGYSLAKI